MGGGGTAADRRAQKLQTDILSRNSYRSHATSMSYGADRESVHMVVSREKRMDWVGPASAQKKTRGLEADGGPVRSQLRLLPAQKTQHRPPKAS